MRSLVKNDDFPSPSEIAREKFPSEPKQLKSLTSLDFLQIEISQICQNILEQFIKNDFNGYFTNFQKIIDLLKPAIDKIHYEQKEKEIIEEFRKISFDAIVLQVCQHLCTSTYINECEIITIIIDIISNLDHTFFSNVYILPFFENILKGNMEFISIISRIISSILPTQIKYDHDFQNFSQCFYMMLDSPIDFQFKVGLLESFINSGANLEIHFGNLLPHLSFFLQMNRTSYEEIRIFTQLLKLNPLILPLLLENGFIHHIITSITTYSEEINLDIINFTILVYSIDESVHEELNIDEICLNYLDDASEENQIAGLSYFQSVPLAALSSLLENDDTVDLIWAIISDGIIIDSTLKLKITSFKILHKILECHNDHFIDCILSSNICEICEILLNLLDSEITPLCLDVLTFVFNISLSDATLAQKFYDEFFESEIENLLENNENQEIELKQKELLDTIHNFYQ